MKSGIAATAILALAAMQDIVTWGACFGFVVLSVFYAWLRYDYHKLMDSDPVKLCKKLADEKEELLERLNRSTVKVDELRASNKSLHSDHQDLRADFRRLTESYGRLAQDFAKIQDAIKAEQNARMEQLGQLIRTQAKHGDL